MKTIIFATTNKDKLREIGEMLRGRSVKVLSMAETGYDLEIEEDGTTFEENARIKAKAVAKYITEQKAEYADAIVLADDSGLEIDYYDKRPGVYSHRWLGEMSYHDKMAEVIADMQAVPEEKRGARFVCSMAAVILPDKELTTVQTVEGRIAYEITGNNGFGYDPFFYVPEYGCTTAEMSPEDKNAISHRGKALRNIINMLNDYLD